MVSKTFSDLKSKLNSNPIPVEEYKSYIDGLILDSVRSIDDFYKEYCAYAMAIGVSYEDIGDAPMRVCLYSSVSEKLSDRVTFEIDPVVCFKIFNSDDDILFCVAHEVKHLLSKHIFRYKDLYKESTTGVLLNLCNDVEVNETLIEELGKKRWEMDSNKVKLVRKRSVPSDMFNMNAMSRILGCEYPVDRLKIICGRGYKYAIDPTISGNLYGLLDAKCKSTLGYNIDEILSRVQIQKSTFSDEIFRMVDYGVSNVFNPKNTEEAIRFCREIARYLKRHVYVLICASGGFGTDSMDTAFGSGSSSGKKKSSGKDNKNSKEKGNSNKESQEDKEKNKESVNSDSTIDQLMNQGQLNELLNDIESARDIYMGDFSNKNYKGKGRSASGSGRSASGSGGGHEMEVVEYSLSIPWQSYLTKKFSTVSKIKDYTKRRINRRQPNRIELSGYIKKPSLELVVCVDESGSMSDDECMYIFSEIATLVKKFKCSVHLYRFTSVVKDYVYIKESENVFKKLKGDEKHLRRFSGGTCFQPVFDAIDKNKKIRKDSIIVMCTDGHGEKDVFFYNMKNRFWIISTPSGAEPTVSCDKGMEKVFPVVPRRVCKTC